MFSPLISSSRDCSARAQAQEKATTSPLQFEWNELISMVHWAENGFCQQHRKKKRNKKLSFVIEIVRIESDSSSSGGGWESWAVLQRVRAVIISAARIMFIQGYKLKTFQRAPFGYFHAIKTPRESQLREQLMVNNQEKKTANVSVI